MPVAIGILGGTFDPPHAGHVAAAVAAQKQLGLDDVRIIPAGQAPLRSGAPAASAADRVAMCRLAFADCAITAHADYLITEDQHFNVLRGSGYPVQPVTPAEFIRRHLTGAATPK